MKFLKEVVETVQVTISEAAEGKAKEYFIEGCFMQGDIKNRNGRIYPMSILQDAVDRYMPMISGKRALGELNHPDHIQINPKEASHLITDLWVEGNKIMGKAKILNTPNGQIVKALLEAGVQLGVSSRGFGSLKEKNGIKEVQSDFTISTVDIVTDPSAPEAFVNPVLESKEFALVDGMIVEVNEATEQAILAKHGFVKQEVIAEETAENKDDALVESFEKVMSEISKDLTKKYLKTAVGQAQAAVRHKARANAPDVIKATGDIIRKRNIGIHRAIDKLAKESVEEVSEANFVNTLKAIHKDDKYGGHFNKGDHVEIKHPQHGWNKPISGKIKKQVSSDSKHYHVAGEDGKTYNAHHTLIRSVGKTNLGLK